MDTSRFNWLLLIGMLLVKRGRVASFSPCELLVCSGSGKFLIPGRFPLIRKKVCAKGMLQDLFVSQQTMLLRTRSAAPRKRTNSIAFLSLLHHQSLPQGLDSDTSQPMLLRPLGRVLVVGDGDLAYSAAVAGQCSLTATTLETEDELVRIHGEVAAANVQRVRAAGGVVQHAVDARVLPVQLGEFDIVVFNFPHATGRLHRSVRANQALLQTFFSSAVARLAPHGRILVTLCQGQGGTPADGEKRQRDGNHWAIEEQAARVGLRVVGAEVVSLASLAERGYVPLRGRVRRHIPAEYAITYSCAMHGDPVFPPRRQTFCAQFWIPEGYEDARFAAVAALTPVPSHVSVQVSLPAIHFYTDPDGCHLRTYAVTVAGPLDRAAANKVVEAVESAAAHDAMPDAIHENE